MKFHWHQSKEGNVKLPVMPLPVVGEKPQFPRGFWWYFIPWLLNVEQTMKQKLAPGSLFSHWVLQRGWYRSISPVSQEQGPSGPKILVDAVTSDKSGSWVHLSCTPENTVAPDNKARLCFALERVNNNIPFRQGHSESPFDTKTSEKNWVQLKSCLSLLFVGIGKKISWSTCRLFWSAALEQNGMVTEGQGTKPPGSCSLKRVWSWCSRKCYLDLLGTNTTKKG